jgi:hypothetical protein
MSGSQSSKLIGNLNPFGITPITVRGVPFHPDGPPNDCRVAAVSARPDGVAEEDHAGRAEPIVIGDEIAPDDRLLAEQSKSAGRDVRAEEHVGRAAFVIEPHGNGSRRAVGRDSGKRRGRRAPVFDLAKRGGHCDIVDGLERHDPVGVFDGKAAPHHRVDERKDGVGGGDAQSQRDGRDQRNPSVLQKQPKRESNVL